MVLTADQLRKTYDSADLLPEDLANHRPLKAIIGQDRAVKALRFGLGNRAPGFNIYLSGVPGEGKIDAVLHFLEDLARLRALRRSAGHSGGLHSVAVLLNQSPATASQKRAISLSVL